MPLDYKLSNGDIVEVITSKQASGPSRDWINIAGSSDTRNKIKSWFKKERKEENIERGRDMLEKECKRLGYNHKEFASQDKLKSVAEKLRLPDVDGLLASLGYGGTTLTAIMSRLVDIYKQEQQKQLQSKKICPNCWRN